MNYQPVIGLEVHLELNTKTKMFCACSADYFGKQPNTHTCPICLGLPGALPFINKSALEKCLTIGVALNCQVSEKSLFERKNYFYPDLPKGYQISQYRFPLCKDGWVEFGGKKIRINRVHQEEDTGKLMHQGASSVVDFNRSGVPLVEIVTEPDFESAEQVREFAKSMQQLFRYLGVSEADMEKGQMRLEANISVKEEGVEGLPNYRIELKNINSFSFMVKAIDYEIKRQSEELQKGTQLTQQTRGWDEDKNQTYPQREKEEAHDYRYFPEPDLSELNLKTEELRVKESLPELPWEAEKRLVEKLGISEADAKILTANGELTTYFEEAATLAIAEQLTAKDVANELIHRKVDTKTVTPSDLVSQLVSKRSSVVSDDSQIESWVQEAINENTKMVEDYKGGKESALMALVGAVMRKSEGRADAGKVKEMLLSKFS